MNSEPVISTLRSNQGESFLEIHCSDFNEGDLLLDLRIGAMEQGDKFHLGKRMEGGLLFQIPQVICRRSALKSFLSELKSWAALPLSDLAESNLSFETELRAVHYTFRDSLVFSVQAPEVLRTVGDQRDFGLIWLQGGNQVKYGFRIDVTGVRQFCEGLSSL